MRVPSFQRLARWSQGGGLFFAGMIVGAAVFMAIYQHNMNLIFEQNHVLKLEYEMLKDNASMQNISEKYISSIVVRVEEHPKEELDVLTKTKIKTLVSKELNVLKGKKVEVIAPQTDNGPKVMKTLYKRLFEDVNGRDYMVEINHYTIVYGELTAWITPVEYKPKSSG